MNHLGTLLATGGLVHSPGHGGGWSVLEFVHRCHDVELVTIRVSLAWVVVGVPVLLLVYLARRLTR